CQSITPLKVTVTWLLPTLSPRSAARGGVTDIPMLLPRPRYGDCRVAMSTSHSRPPADRASLPMVPSPVIQLRGSQRSPISIAAPSRASFVARLAPAISQHATARHRTTDDDVGRCRSQRRHRTPALPTRAVCPRMFKRGYGLTPARWPASLRLTRNEHL